MRLAERLQSLPSLHAHRRLQRTRRVVEPGVDHAAVVGRGFQPGFAMALEHDNLTTAPGQGQGTRETGDTGADDDNHDAKRAARRMASTMLPGSALSWRAMSNAVP